MERVNRTAGAAAICAAMLTGLAPSAQAAYVVTLEQVGSNVVATGSGTLDLSALSIQNQGNTPALLDPAFGILYTGPSFTALAYAYGLFSGPSGFGRGDEEVLASSGSGILAGIDGLGERSAVVVSAGYVSGSPLSDSSTYDHQTLASLGATPGVYTWTWGSGATADSFTLDVKAVPEPSTWAMMLVGFAGLGFLGLRSRRGLAA